MASSSAGDVCKNNVSKMKTIGDFRSVLVTLVSNAKCDSDSTMTMKCYAIMGALDEFEWINLNVGTIYIILGAFL